MVPWVEIRPFLGLKTKYAMPALVTPPTLTAVSRAPQSLPLANATCCMRESLLSSLNSGLSRRAVAPTSRRQAASAMQSRRGRLVLGFWSDLGGTPYCWTSIAFAFRTTAGLALLSDRVGPEAGAWCAFPVDDR